MVPLIRPALPTDAPFLWQMLAYAAHLAEEGPAALAAMRTHPALRKYVQDWGRSADVGYLALDPAHQQPIGAAWMRLFRPDEQPLLSSEEALPELAIAVLPTYRGQGVGTLLLTQVLNAARPHYSAVVLSVRQTNPAKALYERMGFVVVDTTTNRVGTASWIMCLEL